MSVQSEDYKMSEYEKRRLENICRNQAMLSELKIEMVC